MSIVNGIVMYIVIWWVVFFVALPYGVQTADEAGEDITPGSVSSAPVKPRIGRKIAITTVVAAVLWSGYYAIVAYDLVSLRPQTMAPGF